MLAAGQRPFSHPGAITVFLVIVKFRGANNFARWSFFFVTPEICGFGADLVDAPIYRTERKTISSR